MNRFLLVALILIMSAGNVSADEGMWLPSLIEKLNVAEMKEMGCRLEAEDIYSINHSSLKDAIVSLDHGSCTAEIISPEGLILTNYHCGFDEIQSHSTVDLDFLKDGFWASKKEDELANIGKTASILIRMEDVTDTIMSVMKSDTLSADKKDEEIFELVTRLENDAVGDSSHYEAIIEPMFENNKYYLFVYETFRDVRLVGAPPQSIGKFGGETDNWMWPRHTGDFCLFRIYCGKDGKPADYSEDNVPYKPNRHLKISMDGYKEGDFTMILGYPGTTTRYQTSYGINFLMEVTNPARIKVREAKLGIMKDYMKTSERARIQYASKYAESSNYYKYSIGQNKGLKDLEIQEEKRLLEEQFTEWVNADSQRIAKYGKALKQIQHSFDDIKDETAYQYLIEAMIRGPEIYYFAYRIRPLYDALMSSKKNNHVNLTNDRLKEKLNNFFKDYDVETDKKMAAALFKIYQENVDPLYHPPFMRVVEKKYKNDFNKYMDHVFSKSIFPYKEKLQAFFESPKVKVLDQDPIFKDAVDIFRVLNLIGYEMDETALDLDSGRQLFIEGLFEMKQDYKFYPDANSTMRLTYGTVGGYKPCDAVVFDYFTTLKGYVEKGIPDDLDFDVSDRLVEMYHSGDFGSYADADGTLHTCFITNNDITGGNSGSPLLNADGELIGIAFDGNWEAMSGDVAYEPDLQKCINVDIRFVLWVIDKFAGAKNLIREITIEN